ncbi:MAG: hypothetical protein OEW42_09375 [Acidimicrobiia bacterium]|nr:hypothetical protein [Acidimicrobiia bacterium]MDH5236252.1 hypothetical protein [Acidimicrobiia bacterium]
MTSSPPVEGLPRAHWFVVTFVVYVALALVVKSTVLNWIIGPLWLLITLFLVPNLFRRVRRRVVSD